MEDASFLPKSVTIGLVFGVCAFFSTLLTLLWLFLPATALPFSKTSLIGFSMITLLRMLLCLLLPFVLFSYLYRIPEEKILGQNPGLGAVLLSFLIGCPVTLMMVSAHNLLGRFFLTQGIAIAPSAFSFVSEDHSSESRLLVFVITFLLPVLLQELYFRGLLFSVFPRKIAGYQRILFTAFFFALFIQSPIDFVPIFLLGVLLGYIRQATNSLLCPILVQCGMLLTYVLFSRLLPVLDLTALRSAVDLDLSSQYSAIAAPLISLLAFLPLLAQIRRTSKDAEAYAQQAADDSAVRLHEQFGWSFWLGLLFFAASWVLLLGI
jgi:membrane protease YdiL (CAAX protease family)